MRTKYLFLLASSFVVAQPAWAQTSAPIDSPLVDHVVQDDEITVTATGVITMRVDSGQSISVLTADHLRLSQGPDLTRALERLPGVSFARSGGLGSQTSMFVRGANSEQLLVTIDGVRVEDVAAPSGGFDLGTLLAGGIGKVELLRGSNSLAWGSDAIGGVLALSSERLSGQRAAVEYGAHNLVDANAGFGREGLGYAFGLSAGYLRSNGISAFAGGTETDPFRQWHVGGSGFYDLSSAFRVVLAGRYADSRIDFDGFPPPSYTFADTPEYQTTRQASGRIGFERTLRDPDISGGIAFSDTRRDYFDPTVSTAPNFSTAGRSIHADLKAAPYLGVYWSLDLGADADWSRFSTTFDPQQNASIFGAHALLGYRRDALSLTGGARIDDHDRFGTHATFGANGSYWLGGRWRIKGSWGQGFKAPTLSQLYGYGGNALLKPETSNGFDAGIEYDQRNAGRHFALTVFRRDSSNLIDYVFPTGYFNVSRTRAQGVELEAGARFDKLTLSGAYTYLEATDRSTGNDLARRPRHLATLSADWETPLHKLTVGADVRLVGDSFDDRGNFTRLDGYGLLTLRASVPLGEHLELYGRVENVTDKRYQTVAGYGTYGRSAYGGVRVKW